MTKAELKREYPKGCARPSGYAAFFDWAEAQQAHGLKQTLCRHCKQWSFPQDPCECKADQQSGAQEPKP